MAQDQIARDQIASCLVNRSCPSFIIDLTLSVYQGQEGALSLCLCLRFGTNFARVPSIKERVAEYYSKFRPDKLTEVDIIAQAYQNNADELFRRLEARYNSAAVVDEATLQHRWRRQLLCGFFLNNNALIEVASIDTLLSADPLDMKKLVTELEAEHVHNLQRRELRRRLTSMIADVLPLNFRFFLDEVLEAIFNDREFFATVENVESLVQTIIVSEKHIVTQRLQWFFGVYDNQELAALDKWLEKWRCGHEVDFWARLERRYGPEQQPTQVDQHSTCSSVAISSLEADAAPRNIEELQLPEEPLEDAAVDGLPLEQSNPGVGGTLLNTTKVLVDACCGDSVPDFPIDEPFVKQTSSQWDEFRKRVLAVTVSPMYENEDDSMSSSRSECPSEELLGIAARPPDERYVAQAQRMGRGYLTRRWFRAAAVHEKAAHYERAVDHYAHYFRQQAIDAHRNAEKVAARWSSQQEREEKERILTANRSAQHSQRNERLEAHKLRKSTHSDDILVAQAKRERKELEKMQAQARFRDAVRCDSIEQSRKRFEFEALHARKLRRHLESIDADFEKW